MNQVGVSDHEVREGSDYELIEEEEEEEQLDDVS